MKNINQSNSCDRRKFIKLAAGASLCVWQMPLLAAQSANASKKKIVWVMLRGALDSLHTIVPTFDPHYSALRPKLSKSFTKNLLTLDGKFQLNPALVNLHTWYKNKEFTPVVAVGSGYSARSHFDGQDFLESGKNKIDHNSGWLARAIEIKSKKALAVSQSTPISLRGSDNVNTWYPSNLKESGDDIYDQLAKLYKDDDVLLSRLQEGLETKSIAEMGKESKKKGTFKDLTSSCAKLLTAENGADCAMLELGGWDTHNNQAGRLHRKLTELDEGLANLKKMLGDTWKDTTVVIATEFGRTARENGTGGTDHGTGSALFIAGGSVKGGKVLGDWPGLEKDKLFQQRDLMPTSNSFYWFSKVLTEQWNFNESDIKRVFPDVSFI